MHAAWRLQSDVVSGWTCCCICRCDPAAARATVAAAFGAFLRGGDLAGLRSQTEVLVAPLVTAFVEQEGSWWFTAGTDDEHGQSAWVCYAQTLTFWGDLFSMACSYSCISISLYGDCDPIAPAVAPSGRAGTAKDGCVITLDLGLNLAALTFQTVACAVWPAACSSSRPARCSSR